MARGSRRTFAGRRAASRAADAALKLPVNSVAPAITGTTTVGQTLTCSQGTWSNTPDAYAFQWNRAGSPIAGATANTRVLAAGDATFTLTCTVTATNLGVSAVATSAATAAIAP
jgi:trimeric autotransporter adhesin